MVSSVNNGVNRGICMPPVISSISIVVCFSYNILISLHIIRSKFIFVTFLMKQLIYNHSSENIKLLYIVFVGWSFSRLFTTLTPSTKYR